MEAIKNIVKLPERKPEESGATQAPTTVKSYDLTKVSETIRAGKSKKANELMGIPARYHGKALIKNKPALQALEAFKAGQSLYLCGATGSGKTHLAIALMNEWGADTIAQGSEGFYFSKGQAVFLPAVELLLEIKESWRNEEDARAESEKKIMDKYASKPLLVVDDLGAEKVSEWSRSVVYLLIDRRYRNNLQTIITSNLSPGQLADQLDTRIASRINEMGAVIDLGTHDYRL